MDLVDMASNKLTKWKTNYSMLVEVWRDSENIPTRAKIDQLEDYISVGSKYSTLGNSYGVIKHVSYDLEAKVQGYG